MPEKIRNGGRVRPRTTDHAPRKDDGQQIARLRRVCLAIPGTVEKISHGEPTFFTPKRVFAMFANNHHHDGHIAVWVPAAPGVQEALIEEAPAVYFRPPYVGAAGWVGVELDAVEDETLGALVREAFGLVSAKDRPARKRAGAGERGAQTAGLPHAAAGPGSRKRRS